MLPCLGITNSCAVSFPCHILEESLHEMASMLGSSSSTSRLSATHFGCMACSDQREKTPRTAGSDCLRFTLYCMLLLTSLVCQADLYLNSVRVRHCFHVWKHRYDEVKKIKLADRFAVMSRQQRCFTALHTFTIHRKAIRRNEIEFRKIWKRMTLKQTFDKWHFETQYALWIFLAA